MNVAIQVLATVNAPYGTNLSARQLAALIVDPKSAGDCIAPVFSFFSEISLSVQRQFMADMGVDAVKASQLASEFSSLAGYQLPLAA